MSWKKKGKELMLCPRCKRPTLRPASNISGWLDSSSYKCSDEKCGYIGRFFITIDPEQVKKQSGEKEYDQDAGDKPDG